MKRAQKSSLQRSFFRGFTLPELLIVVAIIAILATLAYPSYSAWVLKGNRTEAQKLLMNWANNQEIWRANNPTYASADNLAVPTHDDYTFSLENVSATTYTLVATPNSGSHQESDKYGDINCYPLVLTENGSKGIHVTDEDGNTSLEAYCWKY